MLPDSVSQVETETRPQHVGQGQHAIRSPTANGRPCKPLNHTFLCPMCMAAAEEKHTNVRRPTELAGGRGGRELLTHGAYATAEANDESSREGLLESGKVECQQNGCVLDRLREVQMAKQYGERGTSQTGEKCGETGETCSGVCGVPVSARDAFRA